jgi:hypothetical protein
VNTSKREYYFGSYGLIRGYGPLCRTLKEADATVHADGRRQRLKGGASDRNAVAVSSSTGLCWWTDDDDTDGNMEPVKTASGEQARYSEEVIRASERLWECPKELPGFR